MSKAFLPDDAPTPEVVPPPRTETLPVTARGHRELLEARREAEARGDAHAMARLDGILGSVEVIASTLDPRGGAGFGCALEVEDENGVQKCYELVGPDEIDAPRGRISLASPLGTRLRGARVGDVVELERGGEVIELTVRKVSPI